MKSLSQSLIKYTIWAFIFMGATYTYAVGTWVEPTGAAPSGNTDTPLNLGTAAQNKTGALGATQFCDSVGANCLSTTQIISTSSTSQTKSGFLWAGGFGSTAGGYFATTLGVATTTDPATKGLKALFNGNVGASSYCDTNGANCITPSTVSNSGVPAGAIMAFNLSSCPSGWTAATAIQGRYIVGLPSGGTLGGTAGTALTNQENRAVGQHSHTYDQPVSSGKVLGALSGSSIFAPGSRSTGSAGSVAGTNAPYIQYLMCQKS